MSLDALVFGLAIAGYFCLGLSTILHSFERGSRVLAALTALIVVCHVFGIWAHRFDWSLAAATKNGWRGFFLFHLALMAIVAAALWRGRAAPLTYVGFLVVTGGAVGAVFKYDFVAHLRILVLLVAGTTLAVGGFAHLRRWREKRRT